MEERYRAIVAAVDAEFARNRALHGERIRCRPGCSECCHHVFSISELEAAEIGKAVEGLEPGAREAMKARAREYIEAGLLRGARLPCPALVDGACSIYERRPVLCHAFGMPLYDPDKPERIMACELNFREGEEIEDPQLVQIQTGIQREWKALRAAGGRMTVAHAVLGGEGASHSLITQNPTPHPSTDRLNTPNLSHRHGTSDA